MYGYPSPYRKGYASSLFSPISLVVSTSKGDDGSTIQAITTDAIDTTGCSLLVVAISCNHASAGESTITDSKSNTWVELTERESGSYIQLVYAKNPTVGTNHTFSWAGTGGKAYPTLMVAGFNRTDTSANADQENGATSASASTLATGSITPTTANQLIVTAVSHGQGSVTIDSGFTEIADVGQVGAQHVAGAMAYKVQTSAAAVNPTWNAGGAGTIAAAIASFKHV